MQTLTCAVSSVEEQAIASSPLEALLEASGDVTLHLNEQGQATFTSRSAQIWAGADVFTVGSSFFDLFEAPVKPEVVQAFNAVLKNGKLLTMTAPLRSGMARSLTWKLCRYVVGAKTGVLAVAHDISAQQELELRVAQTTKYDNLTTLPNRATAQELCEAIQTEALVAGHTTAFALISISGLTKINNAMGSRVGDQVLVEVVDRLNEFIAGQARLVRIGSTEFGVFVKGESNKDAFVRSARQLVSLLEAPYVSGRESLHVKARVGITSVSDTRASFDEFFAAASKALRGAREFSQVAYLDINKGGIPEAKEFMRLESALHEGVRNGELYLVYQPLYNASGLYGVEALMRWKQANGADVSPATFIPVAEANGLIQMLGEWALKRATFEVASFNRQHGKSLQVSVNVSPIQFLYPGFSRSVDATLSASGLPPELLQLEITEGTLMAAPDLVEPLLQTLAAKGVQIAVDDFGTGYSSLGYLKRFALSTLKIDQSFVRELPNNVADLAVCAAISELSQRLNLKLVAEGIETVEQRDAIKGICPTAGYQGYFFGKPAPLSQLTA
jgi:diguanylate cyclase (GGDEF)-like protein